MKATIKPHQGITVHRDNTVSYFSVYRQVWQRVGIFELVNRHGDFAALTKSDRAQINRALGVETAVPEGFYVNDDPRGFALTQTERTK